MVVKLKEIKIGDKLEIQCYKHNGKVHRYWSEAVLLDKKKNYMLFGNDKTQVIEAEGNVWKTKEPAIMYFFDNEWFNIIVQLKKDGIYYYCNIASPFIIEEGTIKYIDYDLDLRIFPDGEYKILDQMEYNYHKRIMNYSDELDSVITSALDRLIQKYKEGVIMFSKKKNLEYYSQYKQIKENLKKCNFN